MKDNTQEMLRRARELMGSGQAFQPMGMEAAKAKMEQHLNGGISNARDRLRESAQCEQTVLALNDLLNETQKKSMLLVADNNRLRAELAELRKQPAAVPELVRYCCSCQSVGEVDPRCVSCCPDAPGSVGYVSARFASRLAREFNVVRNGAAAVPEAVAKDAARLDFLIAERAIVQNHIFTEGARFWVSWPVLGEDQRNLYKSPREAIDAALLSAADTEVKK